jgi:hypothetical protein
MSTTELLNIHQVAASQNQKEVTINDAIVALERAFQRTMIVDLSSNVTLTETEFTRNVAFRCQLHSGPAILTVPKTIGGNTSNRFFIVENQGTYEVTVTLGSGDTVAIPAGDASLILSDGANLLGLAGGTSGGGGGGGDIIVRDEGTQLTGSVLSFDFTGTGVTATDDGSGNITVDITGGGGSLAVEDQNSVETSAATVLDFVGELVSASDDGTGRVTVTAALPVFDDGAAVETDAAQLNFTGAGVLVTTDPQTHVVTIDIPGSSGGGVIEVNDEGGAITGDLQSLNFVGPIVEATDDGSGNVTVDVSIVVKDEGTQQTGSMRSLDFVGTGVTTTDDGAGNITVDIPGSTGGASVPVYESGVQQTGAVASFNFKGDVTVADDGSGNVEIDVNGGGGGGSSVLVYDENIQQTNALASLDFTGSGVIATDDGSGNITISIPGGSGAAIPVEDDGVQETGDVTKFNFTGPTTSVTADGAGVATVDVTPEIDIGTFVAGVPLDGEVVLQFVSTRSFTLPTGLNGSQGFAGIAATNQANFDIQKNGATIGSMTFAASGTVATFTHAGGTAFGPGDRLSVIAPGAADASLSNISFTLKGTVN